MVIRDATTLCTSRSPAALLSSSHLAQIQTFALSSAPVLQPCDHPLCSHTCVPWPWWHLEPRAGLRGTAVSLQLFPFEEMMKYCLCSEPWLTQQFLWGDKMITFGLVAADLGQNYTTQESIPAPNPAGIWDHLLFRLQDSLFGLEELQRDVQVFWMFLHSKSDLHFFWNFSLLWVKFYSSSHRLGWSKITWGGL